MFSGWGWFARNNLQWRTEDAQHAIAEELEGRVLFSRVSIVEFSLPPGSGPGDLVAGPDGNMWFCENGSGKLGEVTPS